MLASTTYILPVLFLTYPGLLWQGGYPAIAEALASGLAFSLSCCSIFGRRKVTGLYGIDVVIFMGVAVLALMTSWLAAFAAWAILAVSFVVEWKMKKSMA
jgi:hypothetical protein